MSRDVARCCSRPDSQKTCRVARRGTKQSHDDILGYIRYVSVTRIAPRGRADLQILKDRSFLKTQSIDAERLLSAAALENWAASA